MSRSRWATYTLTSIVLLVCLCVFIARDAMVSRSCNERFMSAMGRDVKTTKTKLKRIYDSLLYHQGVFGCLPPSSVVDSDGQVLYSWRLQVGPDVESVKEWGDFNRGKPWYSEGHARLRRFPGAAGFGYADGGAAKFLRISGEGTAAEPGRFCTFSEMPPELIVLIEDSSSGLFWMEPGDVPIDEIRTGSCERFVSEGRRGFAVTFADGATWEIGADAPGRVVADCCNATRTGHEAIHKLSKYRTD